jgi:hypothetical protein
LGLCQAKTELGNSRFVPSLWIENVRKRYRASRQKKQKAKENITAKEI